MPRRPLCTDQLSTGCWHEPAARALERKYIQINPPRTALWLAFDIDRPAGGLAWQGSNLPQPAWSCTTPENGHGHLVYGLSIPVSGNDLSSKAVRYMEAIKEGFRVALGADPGFAGLLNKNPQHPYWIVERGLQKLWTLGELAEYVSLPSTDALALGKNQDLGGLGRNCDTFDRLRFWAYGAIDGLKAGGQAHWASAVGQKLDQLNELNAPPLTAAELKHIANSVQRWVWNRYTGSGGKFNLRASELGKLGGRPRTTTANGQPWVLAGVDRSTWYRHQRNNTVQASVNC